MVSEKKMSELESSCVKVEMFQLLKKEILFALDPTKYTLSC